MKILFIDTTHPVLVTLFKQKKWEVVVKNNTSKEDLKKELHLYQGIIIRSRFKLDTDFLQYGTTLKFIGRPGAGLENIDLIYCKKAGIEVFRSPEGNRDAVAEHTIGMLLMLFNKLNEANNQVKNGIWDRISNRGEELKGKTIGILGYGFMGEAFAKKLQGFGVTVIAYDKYKTNFGNKYVQEVSLQELFNQTDVLSLHTPLTPETIGFINNEFMTNFKKNFYFINTARGQSVVLADLVDALKKGKIKGACLDVLEVENTHFESLFLDKKNKNLLYLFEHKNVVLTPHVAGWTHQSNEKMNKIFGKKIINYFN